MRKTDEPGDLLPAGSPGHGIHTLQLTFTSQCVKCYDQRDIKDLLPTNTWNIREDFLEKVACELRLQGSLDLIMGEVDKGQCSLQSIFSVSVTMLSRSPTASHLTPEPPSKADTIVTSILQMRMLKPGNTKSSAESHISRTH